MNLLIGILGISFLAIVHETGHYLAARAFGMRVLYYSIGFGPPLIRYQPKGSPTTFQISAIPFLAYVQIDGMYVPGDADRSDPSLYVNKSAFARFVTNVAGPLANYLAASVILFFVAVLSGWDHPNPPMVVSTIEPGSPAATAGLQEGDHIVEADGRPIAGFADLQAVTEVRPGQATEYIVVRDGRRLPIEITPRQDPDGIGRIGVYRPSLREAVSIPQAAWIAVEQPAALTLANIIGISQMVQQRSIEHLSGPVQMSRMAAQQAERGPRDLIIFLAIVSVALGFFNLLPFPALDGGKLIFIAFELITRRRANQEVEMVIHSIGLLLLLLLVAFITFRELTS